MLMELHHVIAGSGFESRWSSDEKGVIAQLVRARKVCFIDPLSSPHFLLP